MGFNPQEDLQAEDRCHRIGQTHDVDVYRLLSRDTIDEYMNRLAQDKKNLQDTILEEGSFNSQESDMGSQTKWITVFLDELFGSR